MPDHHQFTISKWWTMPILNRKEVEIQRSELLWPQPGMHALFFFRLPCHYHVQELFNPVNVLISKFFTGLTDRLTDGQNRLLNPFSCMHVQGNDGIFAHW